MFEYIAEVGKDYIYAAVPLLEDALMDRDLVHRQTAAYTIQHLAIGVAGLGCEDALVHLLNYLWPNIFEISPHIVQVSVHLRLRTAVPSTASQCRWHPAVLPTLNLAIAQLLFILLYQRQISPTCRSCPLARPTPAGHHGRHREHARGLGPWRHLVLPPPRPLPPGSQGP